MVLNIIVESEHETQQKDPRVQIFKVLTHPARLAILEILRDGEHCVCHIEAYLGFRQAYISQQLSVLREGGLIQDRRDGWNIFYRVTDERIYQILDTMTNITGLTVFEINRPKKKCSCPKCNP